MQVSIKSDLKQTVKALNKLQRKQIPFAVMSALNNTAFDARKEALAQMPKKLDRPTRFTTGKGAVRVKKSNKKNLTARVFIAPIQAKYLLPQIKGGTYRPERRAFLIPAGVKLNKFGNIPRGKKKRLLTDNNKFFSGVPKGMLDAKPGVWERYGSKKKPKLRRMAVYKDITRYRVRYNFPEIVKGIVARNFKKNFQRSLAFALKSAK